MAAGRIAGAGLVVVAALALAGCGGDDAIDGGSTDGFVLSSSALSRGGTIPGRFAGRMEDDVSPPLSWTGAPEGTASLALIVEDPDAGGFTHWVLYGISASATSIPEGRPHVGRLDDPAGALQGPNDGPGNPGWFGPEPPPGETHRYVFTLYALDADLGLGEGASKDDVLGGIEGHVLGKAVLTAKFER